MQQIELFYRSALQRNRPATVDCTFWQSDSEYGVLLREILHDQVVQKGWKNKNAFQVLHRIRKSDKVTDQVDGPFMKIQHSEYTES